MKTRLLIILGIILTALAISVLFIFPNVLYIFSNDENLLNQIIDVQMNVTGIKSTYEIGEQMTFSVQVKSLGKIVPWPYYRIYQNYVDVSSDPVYSKMYMTPIDPEDKQNSVAWREKTWNFPLHSDDSIRFFNEGNYTLRVDTNTKKHALIHFQVVDSTNEFESINAFSNGVTEIINPKHGQLKYYTTLQVIDDEYLGNTVEEWQHAERFELELQSETVPDHKFYDNLGHLLMKNEMIYQMQILGIENADDDFTVLQGYSLTSDPPHNGYSSIIHSTDGHYYWLQGGTHANQVNYYKTTQLQYPDESKFPEIKSIPSVLPDERIPRISIMEDNGNDLKAEPYHIILSQPEDVEFYNETPGKLTMYLNQEGIEEFSFATAQEISTRSDSGMTWSFDKPGVYIFHAEVPKNIDGKEYKLNTGGAITVLADNMSNLSMAEQIEIAKMLLSSSGLPITSMGQQGTDDVIHIGLDHSIEQLLPESKPYYLKAAQHLIPFDIKIVLDE